MVVGGESVVVAVVVVLVGVVIVNDLFTDALKTGSDKLWECKKIYKK